MRLSHPTPFAAFLFAILLATGSAAAPPSAASLDGLYGFTHAPAMWLANYNGPRMVTPWIGTIALDGAGHVTAATRTWRADYNKDTLIDAFTQTATGTYTVDADGMGTISLTWLPLLPVSGYPPDGEVRQRRSEETWRLALSGDGFEFLQEVTTTLVLSGGIPAGPATEAVEGRASRVTPCEGTVNARARR